MAITSLDAIVAGLIPPENYLKVGGTMEAAGIFHSLFYTSGRPGAAVAPSPGLGGAALTSYAGQIPYANPASGNKHLARFGGFASANGTLLLCDRLWHNSGLVVTTTTSQTINSATWPARDRLGATNGDDVLVGIEVSTATTNASPVTNTTMSYTDEGGNSGATGTIASFPATAVAGTFVPFQLGAGDGGVRSIQNVTLGTSYGAGAIHLVAYRVLADLGLLAFVGRELDAVQLGMPRLYNNTVPFLLWLPSATAATTVSGRLIYTEG